MDPHCPQNVRCYVESAATTPIYHPDPIVGADPLILALGVLIIIVLAVIAVGIWRLK
jgi:hypothetical protein